MPAQTPTLPTANGTNPSAYGSYVGGGPAPVPPLQPWIELGRSGLKRYSWDRVFLDAEEILPALRGRLGAMVWKEMSVNEPIIGSSLRLIDLTLRKAKWVVEPASDKPVDKERAEFVDECLHDLGQSGPTWVNTLSEFFSMLTYGWCWAETIFKPRKGRNWRNRRRSSKFNDGRVGWAAFASRAQDTLNGWVYDKDNNLVGMRQLSPPDWQDVIIPRQKSLLLRTTSERDNPEGYSILRTAFTAWWYAKRLRELEGISIERDGAGLPVIKCPPEYLAENATPAQQAVKGILEAIVTNIRRDSKEGILMPLMRDDQGNEMFMLELLTSGGSRQLNIDATIQRYEHRIAMTLLTQFLLLGTTGAGSWSLSSDHSGMFLDGTYAYLQIIADEINDMAIPLLGKMNKWGEDDELPRLRFEPLAKPDLQILSTYLSTIVASGANVLEGNDPLVDYLLEVADLPEMPQELKDEQARQREFDRQMQEDQAQMETASGIMGLDQQDLAAESSQWDLENKADPTTDEQGIPIQPGLANGPLPKGKGAKKPPAAAGKPGRARPVAGAPKGRAKPAAATAKGDPTAAKVPRKAGDDPKRSVRKAWELLPALP